MFFASDNAAPAAPEVMAALAAANAGPALAYGNDAWTRRVEDQVSALFGRKAGTFLVTTGTAANAIALACACPPWGAIVAHEEAHAFADECGAPEFYANGAKMVGLAGRNGKITPDALAALLEKPIWGAPRNVVPAVVTISQASEAGTVYTVEEVAALAAVAHRAGLKLHMDGARLANAAASLGCSVAEMTVEAGVDLLSFGFTKNGAMAAEAIVVFDPALASGLVERRKRGGQLWSKGRFIAAQIEALLADGLWLRLGARANAAAAKLAAGLNDRGLPLAFPVDANEVFPVVPRALAQRLRERGAVFNTWFSEAIDPALAPAADETAIRLVCSWATSAEDIDRFLAAIDAERQKGAPIARGA